MQLSKWEQQSNMLSYPPNQTSWLLPQDDVSRLYLLVGLQFTELGTSKQQSFSERHKLSHQQTPAKQCGALFGAQHPGAAPILAHDPAIVLYVHGIIAVTVVISTNTNWKLIAWNLWITDSVDGRSSSYWFTAATSFYSPLFILYIHFYSYVTCSLRIFLVAHISHSTSCGVQSYLELSVP